MNQNNLIPESIKMKVAEGLAVMAPHLQEWLRTHLIEPRPVRISAGPNGNSMKDLWLVTDHVGEEDASCRIVYDEGNQEFGLERRRLIAALDGTWVATDLFQTQLKVCEPNASSSRSAPNKRLQQTRLSSAVI